jgi:hypothetical protein
MISVGVPYLKSAIAGLLACRSAVSIGVGCLYPFKCKLTLGMRGTEVAPATANHYECASDAVPRCTFLH